MDNFKKHRFLIFLLVFQTIFWKTIVLKWFPWISWSYWYSSILMKFRKTKTMDVLKVTILYLHHWDKVYMFSSCKMEIFFWPGDIFTIKKYDWHQQYLENNFCEENFPKPDIIWEKFKVCKKLVIANQLNFEESKEEGRLLPAHFSPFNSIKDALEKDVSVSFKIYSLFNFFPGLTSQRQSALISSNSR